MYFFININNKKIQVKSNMSILQACELADVSIPRFCYHERLSIAGNCRMCLVEVEKMPKLQASCAMPVMPSMLIKTDTFAVKKAREGVLEFLLINHPLDCPVCDQGGECDLQDQTLVYGGDRGRFREFKRAVEDKHCGPLIKTVMTRCIHCTRCVRFANEVIGVPEFGTSGRGNSIEIGTYIEKAFSSELSGNVIDLCPVGALTSKPYAFLARPWELKSTESIDLFDAIHSNIRIDTRGYEVMRILPKLNEFINDEWISDKARFAFDGLVTQRLTSPLLKVNGLFEPISWIKAIDTISSKIKAVNGANKFGLSVDNFVDLESLAVSKNMINYLNGSFINKNFKKFLNLDFQTNYKFNTTLLNINKSDCCLLIGVNPKTEGVLLNYHLRKKFLSGNFSVAYVGSQLNLTFPSSNLGLSLNKLISVIEGKNPFCQNLRKSKNPIIIIGQSLINSLKLSNLNSLFYIFKTNTNLINSRVNGLNVLSTQASDFCINELGFSNKIYFENNSLDVMLSIGNSFLSINKVSTNFLIYQGHHGCSLAQNADIILPSCVFTEQKSTFSNIEGRYQQTHQVNFSVDKPKENWKILFAIYKNILNKDAHSVYKNVESYVPSINLLFNNAFSSYFKLNFIRFNTSFLNNFYLSSSVFDNFYKTDIISVSSIAMAKCSKQLLKKKIF